jgi:ABC-type spermidine/putrescine transport system permease subunit I
MLASFISFFVNQTVNFGMAAALAMLLLGLVFLSLLLLRRAVPMLTPR